MKAKTVSVHVVVRNAPPLESKVANVTNVKAMQAANNGKGKPQRSPQNRPMVVHLKTGQ